MPQRDGLKNSTDWAISSQAPNRGRFRDYPIGVGLTPEVVGSVKNTDEDIVQPIVKAIEETDERINKLSLHNFNDLTGERFGRLTVLYRCDDYVSRSGGTRPQWTCRCDCGNEVNVIGSNLRRGSTTSCGCSRMEQLISRSTRHGGWAKREKLYNVWHGIRKRCLCKTDEHYPDYGGRGITVCDEWSEYSVFREWALCNGYMEGLSIDRIDVNGNYEPANCRWTDNYGQQNNKRNTIYITHNGTKMSLKEWSRELMIPYNTLYSRYKHGWDTNRLLNK